MENYKLNRNTVNRKEVESKGYLKGRNEENNFYSQKTKQICVSFIFVHTF